MNALDNPVALVLGKVAGFFPEYTVDVQPSADDDFVLCVRVYGVPTSQVSHVEDRVFGLEADILGNTRYILLPMVKNLEVTRRYYPQYLPSAPASPMTVAGARILLDAAWRDQRVSRAMPGMAPDESWSSPPVKGDQRAADEELALAA